MKIIVCGGRDYEDSIHVCDVLGGLHAIYGISAVIHGDAPGADSHAKAWAISMKIPEVAYPAKWMTHGRAAGPLRNQRMLDENDVHEVIAFPGGRGTADMCLRAMKKGIKVTRIPPRTLGELRPEAPQADQEKTR